MNAEMLTDLLKAYHFLCCIGCCEYQLCKACCNETQLHKTIDAFPRSQAIGIESEVVFDISKGGFYLPSLPIIRYDLGYLKRQVCRKDTEIPIRF